MKAFECHLDEVREKKTIRRFFFSYSGKSNRSLDRNGGRQLEQFAFRGIYENR